MFLSLFMRNCLFVNDIFVKTQIIFRCAKT